MKCPVWQLQSYDTTCFPWSKHARLALWLENRKSCSLTWICIQWWLLPKAKYWYNFMKTSWHGTIFCITDSKWGEPIVTSLRGITEKLLYHDPSKTKYHHQKPELTNSLRFPSDTIGIITVTTHGCQGFSYHQSLRCLFKSFFRLTRKKTSKLHITGPSWGDPLWTNGLFSQKANNCRKHFHVVTSSWFRTCIILHL